MIEAKLGSDLSGGVTHAPTFTQAARTVLVVAQQQQIDRGVFGEAVERDVIKAAIRARDQGDPTHVRWCDQHLDRVLDAEGMQINLVAWEGFLADIAKQDPEYGNALREFYRQCCAFNRLDPPELR